MDSIGGLLGGSVSVPAAKTYSAYDLNKNDYDNQIQDQQVQAQNNGLLSKFSTVNSPSAGQVQINPNAGVQNANSQQQLVGQLQSQANGTGPDLAAGILRQGTDRTLAGQAAMAATQGATNPALAQRQLATNAILANQQLAQQAAQTRIQEQQNAQNQLGSVLTNARGQDIGLAENQAGLTQGTNLANLNAGVATNAQNLQGASTFNQQGLAYDQDVRQALQNYNGQQSTNTQNTNQLNESALEDYYKRQQQAQAAQNSAIGGLISGIGSVALGAATGGGSLAAQGIMGALSSGGGSPTSQNPNNPSQTYNQYQNIGDASNSAGPSNVGYAGPPVAPQYNPAYGDAAQSQYFSQLNQPNSNDPNVDWQNAYFQGGR